MTPFEEQENWKYVCLWMLYESDPVNWFNVNDKVWYKEGNAPVWVTSKGESGRIKVVDAQGRPGNVVAADLEPFIGQLHTVQLTKRSL